LYYLYTLTFIYIYICRISVCKWNFYNSWSIKRDRSTKRQNFLPSSKGFEERDVGGSIANTDGCNIFPWSTFARIVQECRSPSLALSHPRFVLLSLSSFLPSFPCYITPISPRANHVSVYLRRLYL